ncbi:MAG TPA: hypothetical protein H9894_04850 [Candidatus Desulfovibrio intestinipullorum]|uniref:Carrier domain-containing protein n=1 Tax=Candidatus Desulfovibrio intestinipullorum TaxID=2838536 RepID=A0A9D1TPB2_9BACT|nr:hypothetical protein [Candidatus Desulfovibrio intestinipullorum]
MKHPWLEEEYSSAIAVVGMAGRFCKAPDLETFWHNLCSGFEAARRLSKSELEQSGCSRASTSHPAFVPVCAQMEDVDKFDAPFFGLSTGEARDMDPQLRLMLETSWHALEHAGYAPDRLENGSVRAGVFAGAAPSSYWLCNVGPNAFNNTGTAFHKAAIVNGQDFLSTWISYKFGFTGPSLNIQTACSTGLVLVATACQHLLDFSCDVALATTASVINPRSWGYVAESGGILSPDGHCRPFDAAASGTLPGEGAGAVVLKRLEDALRDGDRIEALIRGYGISNDGSRRAGFGAPSAEGQALALRLAQTMACVESRDIGYVEAHGTGTYLGDPIEMAGLARVFGPRSRPCPVGSLKGNLGHLGNAAGMASLLKVLLMLKNGHIPPTINFRTLNPALRMDAGRFRIACTNEAWESAGTRLAGISAFGFGGTNCHLVVEETPSWAKDAARFRTAPARKAQAPGAEDAHRDAVFMFSAPDEDGLARCLTLWGEYLLAHPELDLREVAWNLRHGRSLCAFRCALAGHDRMILAQRLLEQGTRSRQAAAETAGTAGTAGTVAAAQGLYCGHAQGAGALVLLFEKGVPEEAACELVSFLDTGRVAPGLVLTEEEAGQPLVRALEDRLPKTCPVVSACEGLPSLPGLFQGAEPVLCRVKAAQETAVRLLAEEYTGTGKGTRLPEGLGDLFGPLRTALVLHAKEGAPLPLAELAAALFAAGLNPVLERNQARRLALPLYPFARISYWLPLQQETGCDAKAGDGQAQGGGGNEEERSREESPEDLVLGIWRAAFELPELGLDDDFYALGGSSMTAVEILTEVESVFGLRVSMNRFNSLRTPRELLDLLNEMALAEDA